MSEDSKQKINREVSEFFSTIEDFGYCTLSKIRNIGVKSKTGKWVCIGLVGGFKSGFQPAPRATIFENESLFVEEQTFDLQNLKAIIDNLIESQLVDTKVGKISFGGHGAQLFLHFNDKAGYVKEWGEEFGSVVLEGYARGEDRNLYDSEKIDLELQSLAYESLYDLALEKVGVEIGPGRAPPIKITAPRYLKVDTSFNENVLNVHLKAHEKINLKKFKMTTIIRREEKVPAIARKELPLINPMPYKKELVEIVHKLSVNDARSATTFLLQRIDKQYKLLHREHSYNYEGVKALRALIHQCLDPDFTTIEKWVTGRGKTSDDFERGITLLLSVLGLSAEWVGSDFEDATQFLLRRSLGVDIVAFAPDNNSIILGQCTTTKPPSEKSAQLKITANEMRNKLNGGITIIPTIFTLLDEDDMKDEVETLKQEGVIVIGKHGLEVLLNDMKLGTSLHNVMSRTFGFPRTVFI